MGSTQRSFFTADPMNTPDRQTDEQTPARREDARLDPSVNTTVDRREARPEPLAGRRLLVVEDGVDHQRLIGCYLKKAGAQVTVAENGAIGRDDALRALAEGRPFDIVLMDMQMPVLDGYSATRALREAGYTLPVIALTAHATTNDRAICLEAGCTDYLSKPIDRHKLIHTLTQHLDAPVEQGAAI